MLATLAGFVAVSIALHAVGVLVARHLPEEGTKVAHSTRWTLQAVLGMCAIFYPDAFVPDFVDSKLPAREMTLSQYATERSELMGVRIALAGEVMYIDSYDGPNNAYGVRLYLEDGAARGVVACLLDDDGPAPFHEGDWVEARGQQQQITGDLLIASACEVIRWDSGDSGEK